MNISELAPAMLAFIMASEGEGEGAGDTTASSDGFMALLGTLDFDAMLFESETLKLEAEKTGDNNYTLKFNGYIFIEGEGKIVGNIEIKIKDGKLSLIDVDFTGYIPEDAADVANLDKYTKETVSIDAKIEMSYGKQTINLPSSLDGYINGDAA